MWKYFFYILRICKFLCVDVNEKFCHRECLRIVSKAPTTSRDATKERSHKRKFLTRKKRLSSYFTDAMYSTATSRQLSIILRGISKFKGTFLRSSIYDFEIVSYGRSFNTSLQNCANEPPFHQHIYGCNTETFLTDIRLFEWRGVVIANYMNRWHISSHIFVNITMRARSLPKFLHSESKFRCCYVIYSRR